MSDQRRQPTRHLPPKFARDARPCGAHREPTGPLHSAVQEHARNVARSMRAFRGHPQANFEFGIRAGDAAGARITSISGTPNLRLKQGLQAIAGTGGQSPGHRAARFEGPSRNFYCHLCPPPPQRRAS